MTFSPYVSIISPTYNHQDTIKQCIKSVLNQTYTNWEMIIIDDNSKDNTQDIIKLYAKKDNRIKYIFHKENYGPYRLVDTYNEALKIAKGELIAILEGDDWWTPHKLETQVPLFKKNPNIVLSYGKAIEITNDGKVIAYREIPLNKKNSGYYTNTPLGKSLEKFIYLYNPIISCTAIIRKKNLYKIGGFKTYEGLPLIDFPTYCYLALEGQFAPINDKVLGYWRRHLNSISFKKTISIFNKDKKFIHDFIKQHLDKLKSLDINIPIDNLNYIHNKTISSIINNHYLIQGRYYIYFNDWSLARKNFRLAMKNSNNFIYKSIASLAYISTFMKVDILKPFVEIRRKIRNITLL